MIPQRIPRYTELWPFCAGNSFLLQRHFNDAGYASLAKRFIELENRSLGREQ